MTHASPVARRRGADHGAQRLRGATAAPDHLAVVVGADGELEHDAAVALLEALDLDLLGVIDETLGEVLEQLGRIHRHDGGQLAMPWMRSSLRTVCDGCAPRASQSRTRGSSRVIVDGLVCGL